MASFSRLYALTMRKIIAEARANEIVGGDCWWRLLAEVAGGGC